MQVLVVGANGQIGRHLVKMLKDSKHHDVRAMVRKEEQADEFKADGIEAVIADLEGPVSDIAAAAQGCDAVVFTAGSGGSTGKDKTLLIDLDGAVKSVEAAEEAGVGRFIMISAIQANNRENWSEKIAPYFVAKHYADRELMRSNLTYTIIRPGGLLNEPATGKIKAAANLERDSIPREDVAATILAALDEEATYNKSFDLVSGDETLAEALKKL